MATMTAVAPRASDINRRRHGWLGGLLVTAVGVSLLVGALEGEMRTANVFIALGIAFGISYRQGRQPFVYLVATCTFLAFGAASWLSYAIPPAHASAAFLAVLSLGPLAVFMIRRARRWPVAIAGLLGTAAFAEAVGVTVIPDALQPLLVPLTLIGVGLQLLVGPRRG